MAANFKGVGVWRVQRESGFKRWFLVMWIRQERSGTQPYAFCCVHECIRKFVTCKQGHLLVQQVVFLANDHAGSELFPFSGLTALCALTG